MLQANDPMLPRQRPEFSARSPFLAPPRRSRSRSINFPEAVIACMVEGRRPSQQEIAIVAAQIWKDSRRSDGPSWQNLPPESPSHKSMIAAARIALGDIPITRPVPSIPSCEPAVWWKPAQPTLSVTDEIAACHPIRSVTE
jgi:hypothetical protein